MVWPTAPAWADASPRRRVVVVGRVRRRFFRAGGATASRTEVVADRVVPARQRARSGGRRAVRAGSSSATVEPRSDRAAGPFVGTVARLRCRSLERGRAPPTGAPVRSITDDQTRSGMTDIQGLLGDEADSLLSYESKGIPDDDLHPARARLRRPRLQGQRPLAPGAAQPAVAVRPRPPRPAPATCRSSRSTRASSTRRAASFAPNPKYFDPKNIVELAIEGGCNAVATTFGVLGLCSRRYAHRIPFIVKLNHNELLTYPNEFDQIMFGSVEQAFDLGAAGVGATIYFGSAESHRQIIEVSEAFQQAHELGMFTVLWCYLRNTAFKVDGVDYHAAADLTGQANHLGVTIEADIIKQKLPDEQRRLQRAAGLRQDPQARLQRADHRPPDRPDPLAGGQLLHGPHRPHQLRRRVQGRRATSPRPCAPRSSTSGPAASA